MIIEGSHKATGNGIFVSDIQEKSAAFHVSDGNMCNKKQIVKFTKSTPMNINLSLKKKVSKRILFLQSPLTSYICLIAVWSESW